MNDILKLIFLTLIQPLVEAIDRNTAAQGGAAGTPCCIPAVTPAEDTPAPAPAPKKREKKAEASPAPAPAPAPAPEPETTPEPEDKGEGEKVPTGTELVEMMAPLCEDPWKQKCIDFKKNVLKFQGPARTIEDPALRAQFAEFINQLLVEKEGEV
jgi:hypothetical protein